MLPTEAVMHAVMLWFRFGLRGNSIILYEGDTSGPRM